MRVQTFFVLMFSLMIGAASGHAQNATLVIEDVCADAGATGIVVHVSLDNSAVGEVAAGEMVIGYDKAVFTVAATGAVAKTDRSEQIDIFSYNAAPEGIKIVFTGIGHSIEAGAGPIAEISVDVSEDASGNYDWTLSGVLLASSLGDEYPTTTSNGVFSVPCGGGAEAALAIGDTCAAAGETVVVQVHLDNSAVSEVAAGEMVIGFDGERLNALPSAKGVFVK